jgi:hypothetical protein
MRRTNGYYLPSSRNSPIWMQRRVNFFCLAPLLEFRHRHDVLAATSSIATNFGLHLAPDALRCTEPMVAVLHLYVLQVDLGRLKEEAGWLPLEKS